MDDSAWASADVVVDDWAAADSVLADVVVDDWAAVDSAAADFAVDDWVVADLVAAVAALVDSAADGFAALVPSSDVLSLGALVPVVVADQ